MGFSEPSNIKFEGAGRSKLIQICSLPRRSQLATVESWLKSVRQSGLLSGSRIFVI